MDDDKIKKMVTPDGFAEVWRDEINQDETYTDTFNRLNQVFEDNFGKPRYSDYDSFRHVRYRNY